MYLQGCILYDADAERVCEQVDRAAFGAWLSWLRERNRKRCRNRHFKSTKFDNGREKGLTENLRLL